MSKKFDSIRDKALKSKAELTEANRIFCDNCGERLIFILEDSKGNSFSVGLSTLLECLEFAIRDGDLPKLPSGWTYTVGMDSSEEVAYNDAHFKRTGRDFET